MRGSEKTLKEILIEFVVLAAFITLTILVLHSPSLTTADTWLLGLLFALRSPALTDLFSYLTLLGDPYIIAALCIAGSLFLVYAKHIGYAVGLAVGVVGAGLSDVLLKIAVERLRPEGFSTLLPDSFSYPSGHATAALALYGLLTYIALRFFPAHKIIILCFGMAIIAGVGASRLYLGVHYPSDVLGGYLLATLWFFAGIKITQISRGKNLFKLK